MTEDDEFKLLEIRLQKDKKMYPPLIKEIDEQIAEREALNRHQVLTANAKQVGGDHYKKMGIQTWDVVDTWPREQRIGYYRGNALKYIMRLGNKDEEIQEAGKGIHYLEKLVEVLKEKL